MPSWWNSFISVSVQIAPERGARVSGPKNVSSGLLADTGCFRRRCARKLLLREGEFVSWAIDVLDCAKLGATQERSCFSMALGRNTHQLSAVCCLNPLFVADYSDIRCHSVLLPHFLLSHTVLQAYFLSSDITGIVCTSGDGASIAGLQLPA